MNKKLQFLAMFMCIATISILLGFLQPVFATPADGGPKKPKTTTASPGVTEVNLSTDFKSLHGDVCYKLFADSVLTIQLWNSRDENSSCTPNCGIEKDFANESEWLNVWKHNGEDIRPYVKKVVFVANQHGYVVNFKGKNVPYMFKGFPNVEEIDFGEANIVVGNTSSMFENCPKLKTINFGDGSFQITKNGAMNAMFKNCTSLKKVDLSSLESNGIVWDMANMFSGCSSLDTVILNNPNFKTRSTTGGVWVTTGGMKMKNMFLGCSSLKYVNMSNITIYGRVCNGEGNVSPDWVQVKGLFKNLSSLEEVYFNDTKFPNVLDFTEMFSGCSNLRKVEMIGNNMAADAVSMYNMFYDCSSLDSLDVSGLGELNRIVNMDGFVEGCTGLRYLNINNLDNSRIHITRLMMKVPQHLILTGVVSLGSKPAPVWTLCRPRTPTFGFARTIVACRVMNISMHLRKETYYISPQNR